MRIKKYILIIVSSLLVFASFPLATFSDSNTDGEDRSNDLSQPGEFSTKDEVVYGKLEANGSVQNMYVVNSFQITEPGEFVDYGDYEDVRNLTNLSEIDQRNSEI